MPGFRPRFTLRRMIVAVALTPIVVFAGKAASDAWGTTRTVISIMSIPNSGRTQSPYEVRGEGRIHFEETYTPWPAVAAAATTTAILGLAWWFAERLREKMSRSDPSD